MTTSAKSFLRQLTSTGGFTLVEMLVAVSLLGLLSIALASAMGLGLRTSYRVNATTEQLDRVRAAQDVLRRTVGSLYPEWTGERPAFVDFLGSVDEMKFIAPGPAALTHPGLSRFHLYTKRTNTGLSLVMAVIADRPGLDGAKSTEAVLLDGARTIEFAYFGLNPTSQTEAWQSRWERQAEPPKLIRIEAGSADGLIWPSLVIRPAVDVDIACEFDALTRRCRGR